MKGAARHGRLLRVLGCGQWSGGLGRVGLVGPLADRRRRTAARVAGLLELVAERVALDRYQDLVRTHLRVADVLAVVAQAVDVALKHLTLVLDLLLAERERVVLRGMRGQPSGQVLGRGQRLDLLIALRRSRGNSGMEHCRRDARRQRTRVRGARDESALSRSRSSG